MIQLAVDWENNAETFWDAFQKQFPHLADLDMFEVTEEEFDQIRALPGWDSGPDYAPHPLIVVD